MLSIPVTQNVWLKIPVTLSIPVTKRLSITVTQNVLLKIICAVMRIDETSVRQTS